MMLWESQAVQLVERSFSAAKLVARQDYEQHVQELIGFSDGDHASYMVGPQSDTTEDLTLDTGGSLGYFAKYFKRAWDDGRGQMVPAYLPFLRRFVAIQATLYHRPPDWRLLTQAREDAPEEQLAIWRDVADRMRYVTRSKARQKRTTLVKTAIAYVRWDGSDVQLDTITPDNFDIWPDENDPTNLQRARMVRHRLPALADVQGPITPERWMVWTHDGPDAEWMVYVVDNNWEVLDNPLFDDNINRYGIFPYVVFNASEQQDRIFQPLDDSLLTAQVGIDLMMTWFQHRRPTGLNIWKLQDDTQTAKLPMGVDFAANVRTDESFEFVDVPFDAPGMASWLQTTLKTYAAMAGVDPDIFSIDGQDFTNALTGLAKAMDRMDVQEVREDAEAYEAYKTREIYPVIARIHNTHDTEEMDESLILVPGWQQSDIPQEPLTDAQAYQAEVNMGAASVVDRIMRREGLSRQDAEIKYRANLAERDEAGTQRQTPPSPDGAVN